MICCLLRYLHATSVTLSKCGSTILLVFTPSKYAWWLRVNLSGAPVTHPVSCVYMVNVFNVVTSLSFCCTDCNWYSCASVGHICLQETEPLPRPVFINCTFWYYLSSVTVPSIICHCCKIMFSHCTLFSNFLHVVCITLPAMSKMIINKIQKPLLSPLLCHFKHNISLSYQTCTLTDKILFSIYIVPGSQI